MNPAVACLRPRASPSGLHCSESSETAFPHRTKGFDHLLRSLLAAESEDLIGDRIHVHDCVGRDSSCAAFAGNKSACSRRFIKRAALRCRFVIDVTRRIPPVLKTILGNDQEIDCRIELPEQVVQPDHLLQTIRRLLLNHHHVEIATAAGAGPEQNNPLRMCRFNRTIALLESTP